MFVPSAAPLATTPLVKPLRFLPLSQSTYMNPAVSASQYLIPADTDCRRAPGTRTTPSLHPTSMQRLALPMTARTPHRRVVVYSPHPLISSLIITTHHHLTNYHHTTFANTDPLSLFRNSGHANHSVSVYRHPSTSQPLPTLTHSLAQ